MRTIKRMLALLLCLVLLASPSALAAEEIRPGEGVLNPDELQSLLENYISRHGQNPDHISVGYVYTETGETWYYNPDAWYYSASMYKVPLMMLFAQMEARGEINRDTEYLGTTFGYLEDSILIRSNNDFAHAMMVQIAPTEPDCRDLYKQFADLPDDYYIDDFRNYSYFTARFMTQVMTTLYTQNERFPHVIDCLLEAQPGEYFRTRIDEYEIAQKYGSLQERNGTNNNHVAGIIYTPHPFILVVMTENDPLPFTTLGELARVFTDFTVETVDPRFEALEAQREAERLDAEENARLAAAAAATPEAAQPAIAVSETPAPAAAQPEEPAAEPAVQTAQPGPSIPAAQTTAQNSVLRIYVLIGAAVLLLVCILLRRLTRRR